MIYIFQFTQLVPVTSYFIGHRWLGSINVREIKTYQRKLFILQEEKCKSRTPRCAQAGYNRAQKFLGRGARSLVVVAAAKLDRYGLRGLEPSQGRPGNRARQVFGWTQRTSSGVTWVFSGFGICTIFCRAVGEKLKEF